MRCWRVRRVRGQVPEPSSPARRFFYLTRPLLLGEVPTFSKTPPSPLNLKRGSTSLLNTLASPKSFTLGNVQMHLTLLLLNQDFPLLRRKDLKPGRPGLYSQTSARPCGVARRVLRNRKLTLLTLGCARQSIQASLMLCSRWHESCECFTHIVRLSKHRGRPCGWMIRPQIGTD